MATERDSLFWRSTRRRRLRPYNCNIPLAEPWYTIPVDYSRSRRRFLYVDCDEVYQSGRRVPLGSVFEEDLPGVEVELERLIPHETLIIPYFWVRGVETEDIETSFEPHTGVTNIRLVDSVEDEYLMRAEWKPEYFGILSALAKANVVVLTGIGKKDGWRFEVRGENQEAIAEFREYCQENDIPMEITAVHAMLPIQGGVTN